METTERPAHGFSSAKRSILEALKRVPGASLSEIASRLRISKVAALRHLANLEGQGLVEREYRPGAVGRPTVHFRLSAGASRLFPQAYAEMSLFALQFIETQLGRDEVVALLRQRTADVLERSRDRMTGKSLAERVDELVRIRDEGGYMAEKGRSRNGRFEFREHNCPILAIAGRYEEACGIERRMFESLLRANVETTHRVVANDPVCRFLVRPRPRPEGV